MKHIFKYMLPRKALVEVNMPAGSRILCVQNQREEIALWVEAEPLMPAQTRYFHLYATGDILDHTRPEQYVGTVQLLGGDFVLHVYEILNH